MNERKFRFPKSLDVARLTSVLPLIAFAWQMMNPQNRAHLAEVTTGTQAALSRESPPTTYNERQEVSEAGLDRTYAKFFTGKEHLVSKKAWTRRYYEGIPGEGIGRSLARLANFYYEKEKLPDESFDAYFERYVDNLRQAANVAKIDFHHLMITLNMSGENQSYGGIKNEYTISKIQGAGVPLARLFGRDYDLVDSLRPYGHYTNLTKSQWISNHFPWILKHFPKGPNESRPVYDTIRFRSEQTIGMMDFEGSLRAQALLVYGSKEAKQIFVQKYPEIVRSYQQTLLELGIDFEPIIDADHYKNRKNNESLNAVKRSLEDSAKKYIQFYSGRLDIFMKDSALSAIGIDPNNLDNWQKFNRTDIWYQLVRHQYSADVNRTDERRAVAEVKEMMQFDFNHRRDRYYRNLMSQQILNPKFLPFLLEQATKSKNDYEIEMLQQMIRDVKRYQLQASVVRQSYLQIARDEGRFETNREFQQLVTAVTTKMLVEVAGSYDPNHLHSQLWNLYRFAAIREISHPFILVQENGFASDASIDPTYAYEGTLKHIDQFVELLMRKGMLYEHPSKHIVAFLQTIYSIQEDKWDMFPNITEGDKYQVKEFYKFLIADGAASLTPTFRSQSIVVNLINK